MDRLKERVLQYLPKRPYCSESNMADMIRIQKIAVTYPTIQLNSPHLCAWLIFDIDITFSAGEYLWEKAGVAVPNLVVINPDNQHYHLYYALAPVYTSLNARRHPMDYLAAIQRTYTRLLGADEGYAHLVCKNPLHSKWNVIVFHDYEYTLGELQDALPVDKLDPKYADKTKSLGYGRNCDLFDSLRYYAYPRVKYMSSCDVWQSHLLQKAEEMNCFQSPLPLSEVRSIATSVARWTWRNRDKISIKERKLQLDMTQPLETRQSIGAYHSHDVRKDATQKRIEEAVNKLKADSHKITQKAIAEISKLNKNTLTKYKDLIKSLK